MNARGATGLTLTEKIVSRHLAGESGAKDVGRGAVARQGEYVLIRPRRIMTHDNTSAVIPKFDGLFGSGEAAEIEDPSQIVLALDHDIQNHTPENLGRYAAIERFAARHGLEFHRAGSGIGHQLMIERRHIVPGSLVVASDSHANAYGALGALGAPVVRTDAAVVWATGRTWWAVPRVVRVELRGTLRAGVSGKDVILALCGGWPRDVENAAVEFTGEGLRTLSISDRIAIANMTTEWGAIACVMEPDERVREYLAERGVDDGVWVSAPMRADEGAVYAAMIELDLELVEPTITGPNRTDMARPACEVERERIAIDAAYLLSCVNARLPDLEEAARVMRGKRVHPRVRFYVAAASAEVQREAERSGAWRTLIDAGAIALPSGCGPCIGLGEGTLGPGETAISATNRNFPGRMGDRSASVYLASPAIVAASAVEGYIAMPRAERTHHRGTENTEKRGRGGEEVQRGEPRRAAEKSEEGTHHRGTEGSERKAKKDNRAEKSDGLSTMIDARSIQSGLSLCSLCLCGESSLPRAILVPESDVSTDAIYAGRHTYRSGMTASEMAAVVFENLDGPEIGSVEPFIGAGDVVLAGRNFGRGSSREQAATALKHRGIAAVVAVSVNATYLRNAINNGLLVMECPGLERVLEELAGVSAEARACGEIGHARLGPAVELDAESGTLTLGEGAMVLRVVPLAPFMRELLEAGGVEQWAKRRRAHHRGTEGTEGKGAGSMKRVAPGARAGLAAQDCGRGAVS